MQGTQSCSWRCNHWQVFMHLALCSYYAPLAIPGIELLPTSISDCWMDIVSIQNPKRTIIGNDVWVGKMQLFLVASLLARRLLIIAAGSVVTKDVPAYHVAGGASRYFKSDFWSAQYRNCWNYMVVASPQEIEKLRPLFNKDISEMSLHMNDPFFSL